MTLLELLDEIQRVRQLGGVNDHTPILNSRTGKPWRLKLAYDHATGEIRATATAPRTPPAPTS